MAITSCTAKTSNTDGWEQGCKDIERFMINLKGLPRIQLHGQGFTPGVKCDREFNKAYLLKFCGPVNERPAAVVANVHEDNGEFNEQTGIFDGTWACCGHVMNVWELWMPYSKRVYAKQIYKAGNIGSEVGVIYLSRPIL